MEGRLSLPIPPESSEEVPKGRLLWHETIIPLLRDGPFVWRSFPMEKRSDNRSFAPFRVNMEVFFRQTPLPTSLPIGETRRAHIFSLSRA